MNVLMLSGDRAVAQGQGGPFERTLKGLSPHLDHIHVLCPKVEKFDPKNVPENVTLKASPAGRLGHKKWLVQQAKSIHQETPLSLVVSHDYGLYQNGKAAAQIKKQLGLPWMSEIHHVPGYPRAASPRENLECLAAKRFIKKFKDQVTSFRVVNTGEMPPFMKNLGVRPEKIVVARSSFVDFSFFTAENRSEDYDLGFCARLVPNKGVDHLLETVQILNDTHPNLRVCILGKGPLQDEIDSLFKTLDPQAERLKRIDWVKDTAALANYYRSIKVLLMSSYNEGGPRVVPEAMACGTAVVAAPVGICSEIIEDGQSGFLVDWQPKMYAQKIKTLLDDDTLRTRAAEGAAKNIAGFGEAEMMENYAHTMKQVAGKS